MPVGAVTWGQPNTIHSTSGDASCVASGFNYRVDIADTLNFIAAVIEGLD